MNMAEVNVSNFEILFQCRNHFLGKEKFHPMKKAQSSSDKNETLHPSWEASRQRKAQEKFEQSNIKGEHIVFNDSD